MEPEERRQSILKAAKKVFAEQGYHKAGVADIIHEAGIARGTFYLYFKSKRNVFSALLDYILETIESNFIPVPYESPDKIFTALLINIDNLKNQFFKDPELAKLLFQESTSLDSDSSERFLEMRHKLAQWMSKVIQEWQKRGVIKTLDAETLSYCLLGSLREVLEQHLISGYLQTDGQKITEDILKLYLFGFIRPEYSQEVIDHWEMIKDKRKGKENHVEKD